MKKGLWIAAVGLVIVAALFLGVWHASRMSGADSSVIATGAIGWLAIILAGFGILTLTDSSNNHHA